MKKKHVLLFLFLTLANYHSFAQATTSLPKSSGKVRLFYIVNFYDKSIIVTENIFIKRSETDTLYSLDKAEDIEMLRLLKADMIIFIKVKKNVKLLSLNELYDVFKVQPKHRNLKVKIDEDYVDYPQTALFSQGSIEKVFLTKGKFGLELSIIEKGYFETKKILKKLLKSGKEPDDLY
jgi:hypothetical protein